MSRLCAAALILAGLLARPAWAHDTVYYYSSDAQGSEVVITDVNRNVVERTYYGPYGEVLNRPLREGPGYTGHEEDAATGLDNMQQRYYDPSARRFPSVDPMPVDTTTGANFNRYAYANDNPYRYVDPDGRNANGTESPGERHDKDVQQAEDGSIEKRFPGEASGIRGMSVDGVSAAESAGNSVASQNRGSSPSTIQNFENAAAAVGHWVRERSSATAEGAAAFGPGVEAQATKQLGSSPDSASGSFVVGEGAYIGATGNFKVFRWGQETSTGTDGKLVVDPSSYVHVKLGAALSLGVSVDLYPHGGAVSVSVGGGFGEQAVVKPPATISFEQNW